MLYSFDLSSLNITDPGQINKAKFSMYVSLTNITNKLILPEKIYRITKPWDENTVHWNSFGHYPGYQDNEYYDSTAIDSCVDVISAGNWMDFDLTEAVKFWIEYPDSNFGIVIKYDDYHPLVGIDQPKNSYNLFGERYTFGTYIHYSSELDKLAKLEIEYEYDDTHASINSGNIINLKEADHFSWKGEKLTIDKNSLSVKM